MFQSENSTWSKIKLFVFTGNISLYLLFIRFNQRGKLGWMLKEIGCTNWKYRFGNNQIKTVGIESCVWFQQMYYLKPLEIIVLGWSKDIFLQCMKTVMLLRISENNRNLYNRSSFTTVVLLKVSALCSLSSLRAGRPGDTSVQWKTWFKSLNSSLDFDSLPIPAYSMYSKTCYTVESIFIHLVHHILETWGKKLLFSPTTWGESGRGGNPSSSLT